jgi:hypothetical protein
MGYNYQRAFYQEISRVGILLRLREAAPNFIHTVPGYAIQVLELKAR